MDVHSPASWLVQFLSCIVCPDVCLSFSAIACILRGISKAFNLCLGGEQKYKTLSQLNVTIAGQNSVVFNLGLKLTFVT